MGECRWHAGGVGITKNKKRWTKDEDQRLLSLVKRHGANWWQQHVKLRGRSALACSRRLKQVLTATNAKGKLSAPEKPPRYRIFKFKLARRRLRNVVFEIPM